MTTTKINVAGEFQMMAQPVNAKAPVRVSKSIEINASGEKVWSVLTNINNWSTWQPDIIKASVSGPLAKGATFEWVSGGARIRSTVHTVEPQRAIGWSGKSLTILAIHNWVMTTNGVTVTLYVNESMDGFLAKILKGYLNKSLEKSLGRWLVFLKNESEKK
jgi:hypothetical protein